MTWWWSPTWKEVGPRLLDWVINRLLKSSPGSLSNVVDVDHRPRSPLSDIQRRRGRRKPRLNITWDILDTTWITWITWPGKHPSKSDVQRCRCRWKPRRTPDVDRPLFACQPVNAGIWASLAPAKNLASTGYFILPSRIKHAQKSCQFPEV